jgi:hypothetical protein
MGRLQHAPAPYAGFCSPLQTKHHEGISGPRLSQVSGDTGSFCFYT